MRSISHCDIRSLWTNDIFHTLLCCYVDTGIIILVNLMGHDARDHSVSIWVGIFYVGTLTKKTITIGCQQNHTFYTNTHKPDTLIDKQHEMIESKVGRLLNLQKRYCFHACLFSSKGETWTTGKCLSYQWNHMIVLNSFIYIFHAGNHGINKRGCIQQSLWCGHMVLPQSPNT